MTDPFRYAMCNEAFEQTPFEDVCKALRNSGYTGIEIAPFTIEPAKRAEYRNIMRSEGIEFVGLHWLMVGPKGLHVTTPDDELRERSWRHVRDLIDLCADLGPGGVMVFGSPNQRSTTGGIGREEATRHFIEGLASVAPHAEERGVTVLVEPLPVEQCDVVQTLAEAVAIVEEINSPSIRTMFDTHNAVNEAEPHAELVERYFDYIRHVHVNEMDGRHPGTGDYDFAPLFQTLGRLGYQGWISLEAFDFSPGGEKIAADSITYLQSQIRKT